MFGFAYHLRLNLFIEAAKGYDGLPRMLRLHLQNLDDPQFRRYSIMSPRMSTAQRFKSWLRRRHQQFLAAEAQLRNHR
jgi:hypothetical protein